MVGVTPPWQRRIHALAIRRILTNKVRSDLLPVHAVEAPLEDHTLERSVADLAERMQIHIHIVTTNDADGMRLLIDDPIRARIIFLADTPELRDRRLAVANDGHIVPARVEGLVGIPRIVQIEVGLIAPAIFRYDNHMERIGAMEVVIIPDDEMRIAWTRHGVDAHPHLVIGILIIRVTVRLGPHCDLVANLNRVVRSQCVVPIDPEVSRIVLARPHLDLEGIDSIFALGRHIVDLGNPAGRVVRIHIDPELVDRRAFLLRAGVVVGDHPDAVISTTGTGPFEIVDCAARGPRWTPSHVINHVAVITLPLYPQFDSLDVLLVIRQRAVDVHIIPEADFGHAVKDAIREGDDLLTHAIPGLIPHAIQRRPFWWRILAEDELAVAGAEVVQTGVVGVERQGDNQAVIRGWHGCPGEFRPLILIEGVGLNCHIIRITDIHPHTVKIGEGVDTVERQSQLADAPQQVHRFAAVGHEIRAVVRASELATDRQHAVNGEGVCRERPVTVATGDLNTTHPFVARTIARVDIKVVAPGAVRVFLEHITDIALEVEGPRVRTLAIEVPKHGYTRAAFDRRHLQPSGLHVRLARNRVGIIESGQQGSSVDNRTALVQDIVVGRRNIIFSLDDSRLIDPQRPDIGGIVAVVILHDHAQVKALLADVVRPRLEVDAFGRVAKETPVNRVVNGLDVAPLACLVRVLAQPVACAILESQRRKPSINRGWGEDGLNTIWRIRLDVIDVRLRARVCRVGRAVNHVDLDASRRRDVIQPDCDLADDIVARIAISDRVLGDHTELIPVLRIRMAGQCEEAVQIPCKVEVFTDMAHDRG